MSATARHLHHTSSFDEEPIRASRISRPLNNTVNANHHNHQPQHQGNSPGRRLTSRPSLKLTIPQKMYGTSDPNNSKSIADEKAQLFHHISTAPVLRNRSACGSGGGYLNVKNVSPSALTLNSSDVKNNNERFNFGADFKGVCFLFCLKDLCNLGSCCRN